MLELQLQKSFGLASFRTGQREIIETVLQQKDALAVLPTGAGKSLCFQFSAVYKNQLVIVISPLVAVTPAARESMAMLLAKLFKLERHAH